MSSAQLLNGLVHCYDKCSEAEKRATTTHHAHGILGSLALLSNSLCLDLFCTMAAPHCMISMKLHCLDALLRFGRALH